MRFHPIATRTAGAAIRIAVLATLVASCTRDLPVRPSHPRPELEIHDAAHNSGSQHFFFLPPMVPQPSYSGKFDGSLLPVVRICEWTGAACALPLLAEFTTTTGPGSETVQVNPTDELYIVNWRTSQFTLDVAKTYRISVFVDGTELGHADVDLVSRSSELKDVNTGQYIPLANGRTLPIKFRIEEGWRPALPSLIVFTSVEPCCNDHDGGPQGEIYKVLSDGSNLTRLTNDALLDGAPALSPDGSLIAWNTRRSAFGVFENIWVMPVSGASRVRLTLNSGVIDYYPAWSFDGSRIAFISTRDLHHLPEGREVYVMNADGSGQARVTNNLFWDDNPNWSPDGRIAFRSIRNGESDIYMINPDGSNEVRVTTTGNNGSPAWSPDGQWMAFVSSRDGNDEIYVMAADGSSVTRLTFTAAGEETPTWSPDGLQIAFGRSLQIFVMNADGSQQKQITNLPNPTGGPRWRN